MELFTFEKKMYHDSWSEIKIKIRPLGCFIIGVVLSVLVLIVCY